MSTLISFAFTLGQTVRHSVAFAAVAACIGFSHAALAQNSINSYEKIAEGGNGAPGFTFKEVGQALINASGRVAFSDTNTQTGVGIYSTPGAGQAYTTVFTPAASGGYMPTVNSMNASGTVAFAIYDQPTAQGRVYTGNGGATTWASNPTTAPGYPNFQTYGRFPTINDAGSVAFGATTYDANTGQSAYYVGVNQNGTFNPLIPATYSGNFNGMNFNNFYDARMNNGGQIALLANSTSNRGYVYRRNTDGSITTIATNIQPSNYVGFNDLGYVGYFRTGNSDLLLSNGVNTITIGNSTTLDPLSGLPIGTYGFNLSVNNLNQVAFIGGGVNNGAPIGVFVGDGSKIITVARVGDSLFGSTITSLGMSDQAINDAGQVVFTATLANGRTEVLRGVLPGASVVPEANTAALLSLALPVVGAVVMRRRTARK